MSVVFKTGSIFDSNCEALVNPVNCVGVMGKGLALEFKQRYPENYHDYKQLLKIQPSWLRIERVFVYENPTNYEHIFIINLATKNDWRENSTIDFIEESLRKLANYFNESMLESVDFSPCSVAIPKLGRGCGGLDWKDVKPLIVNFCEQFPNIEFEIYE